MKRYKVHVIRTGYGHHDIEVDANSKKEAEKKALEQAGDYDFSEYDSDYEVEYAKEV